MTDVSTYHTNLSVTMDGPVELPMGELDDVNGGLIFAPFAIAYAMNGAVGVAHLAGWYVGFGLTVGAGLVAIP